MFRTLELSDREWMTELLKSEDSRSADFNFGNIYMWDMRYEQLVTRINDRVVIRPSFTNECYYAFPVGRGPLEPVIDALLEMSCSYGCKLTIRGVEARHRQELEALYPVKFAFSEERDLSDYIYSAEKLASLAGKKLHGKRGHINRFLAENPDWSFRPLTSELMPQCLDMLAAWEPQSPEFGDDGLLHEHQAITRGFEAFDELGLFGGALFAGAKLVSFTVGEMTNSDTLNVHFEKAFSSVNGAYPMINREFVRYAMSLHPEIRYVNREDDTGRENLRKAKLSYDPLYILEKYTATWK